nr:substrate-binding domain-containing protein [Streptomyces sp. NRRL S-646]
MPNCRPTERGEPGRPGASSCPSAPERISVLGFDDQLMAEWLDLSTVAQSPSDMGRAAAELALVYRMDRY